MNVRGRVVVDAMTTEKWTSFEEDDRISQLVKSAAYAPAGADVEIRVASRQMPSFALDYLREHGQHLGSLTIVAPDGETITRWVRALRDGAAVTFR